ncbi:LURP-one-related family protein [uncultured Streptococcus sp.]|uniref:LURP-one-related/scramblase family protein n=1 Tax=uncultured Streptococcus sp. TaxID=83427 RepID=UPI0028D16D7A|nr:LURP-one-related family protein [uncultured Streptococcus sp.]
MKTYLVKQKFRLGGERFDIKNDLGMVEYQVEGSFLKIPKTFTVFDVEGQKVSHITKKTFSLLPQFTVELEDGSSFFIRKKLTLFRDKYDISNLGLRIEGNIWDLDFKLLDDRDQLVAEISKQVFTLTSTYQVSVYEEEYANLVISLCLAIDYVEMMENGS